MDPTQLVEDNTLKHGTAIYLEENRYEQPKEMFKQLAELAKQRGVLKAGSVVCDFGCAAGEFLYHLRRECPMATYSGYDVVSELLDKARTKVPGVAFQHGSVLDRSLRPPASADLTFLVGVHSLFEDFEPCVSNLLQWTRPGGAIYIAGLFNPYPADVWVTYRLADAPRGQRESGWNLFSKASVSRYLDALATPVGYTFLPFVMPCDVAPHPRDVVRTWTFRDERNRRVFTNGLSLLCHLEILEIRPHR